MIKTDIYNAIRNLLSGYRNTGAFEYEEIDEGDIEPITYSLRIGNSNSMVQLISLDELIEQIQTIEEMKLDIRNKNFEYPFLKELCDEYSLIGSIVYSEYPYAKKLNEPTEEVMRKRIIPHLKNSRFFVLTHKLSFDEGVN